MNIICFFKDHKWSNWAYKEEGSCIKVRSCKRCPKIEYQGYPTHDWSNWVYKEESSCIKVRSCKRCREIQSDIVHQWSGWVYEKEGNCQASRFCKRCPKIENDVVHQWSKEEETCTAPNCYGGHTDYQIPLYCHHCGGTGVIEEYRCSRCRALKPDWVFLDS